LSVRRGCRRIDVLAICLNHTHCYGWARIEGTARMCLEILSKQGPHEAHCRDVFDFKGGKKLCK